MAEAAFGTSLLKGGIGGDEIAELTNIGGLDLDSDEIDVTHHQSAGMYEEVIQSIKRTGEVTLEGNFDPSDVGGQVALWDDYVASAVDDYAIVFPDALATAWTFRAFVKQPPSTEAPVDGKVPFTATLRVTGQPSLDIDFTDDLTDLTADLEISGATAFIPVFAGDTYSYTLSAAAGDGYVDLTPTGAHTIHINGALVPSLAPFRVTLEAAGEVTHITVTHQASGHIARVYKIAVARAS